VIYDGDMNPSEVTPGATTITQHWGCTDFQGEWYCPSCASQRFHDGVDLADWGCEGTPILSVGSGVVQAIGQTWAGSDGLGPGAILIRMDDGKYAGYGHGYAEVSVGQRVAKGQRIGRVGNQGNSTGPHLHLMIRTQLGTIPGGQNPLNYDGPGGPAQQEDDLTPEQAKQLEECRNWMAELLTNNNSRDFPTMSNIWKWHAGGQGPTGQGQQVRDMTGHVWTSTVGDDIKKRYGTDIAGMVNECLTRLEAIEKKLGL